MPGFLKMKSKEDMAAPSKNMIARGSSCSRHNSHPEIIEWDPSSEEEEARQDEVQVELQKGEKLLNGADSRAMPSRYSLKYGFLRRSPSCKSNRDGMSSSIRSAQRSKPQQLFASASSDSLCSSSSSPSSQTWDELSAQRSNHIKRLLSELASSIASSKAAFGLLRASSSALPSAQDAYSRAREVMAEELQTLSDVQMRLYSSIQHHDVGEKPDYASDTSMSMSSASKHSLQRHNEQLKSYEGIITRFHNELQRKDVVIEALKETLAKSILKGEKLERRIKEFESKLSSPT